MMKTILITGSIAMVVGFSGTLLTLFGPNTLTTQYAKFMLLLFLVILVGSYWFVMVPPGRGPQQREGQERETPSGREAEGDTPL